MKFFKIDGVNQKVFTLTESEVKDGKQRIVYIPVTGVHYVDYKRLVEAESKTKKDYTLLDVLHETTLNNGKNALVYFDNVIQVAEIDGNEGQRILKTEERIAREKAREIAKAQAEIKTDELSSIVSAVVKGLTGEKEVDVPTTQETQTPVRKKPGPKPKAKK